MYAEISMRNRYHISGVSERMLKHCVPFGIAAILSPVVPGQENVEKNSVVSSFPWFFNTGYKMDIKSRWELLSTPTNAGDESCHTTKKKRGVSKYAH